MNNRVALLCERSHIQSNAFNMSTSKTIKRKFSVKKGSLIELY